MHIICVHELQQNREKCNIDTSEICFTHDINLSVKCQFERKIKSKM